MKKFFFFLALTIVMIAFTACSNEKEGAREMDIGEKVEYAQHVDFNLQIFSLGHEEWLQGRSTDFYGRVRSLIDPDSDLFADFYTEVRFVHHPDEAVDIQNTVILAFPTDDTEKHVVTALNWEVISANLDLSDFGLSYPITIEDLVNNYEGVNRLIHHEDWLRLSLFRFANSYHTRIEFELDRINDRREGNVEKVLAILEQLNMTQDEAGPILRAAGSFDAFVAVTDLMLTQGLSAEDALARYRR